MKCTTKWLTLLAVVLLAAALLSVSALAVGQDVTTASSMPSQLQKMALDDFGYDVSQTATYEVEITGSTSGLKTLSLVVPYPGGTDQNTIFDTFIMSGSGNAWGQSGEEIVKCTSDGVEVIVDDVTSSYTVVLAWGQHSGGPGGPGGPGGGPGMGPRLEKYSVPARLADKVAGFDNVLEYRWYTADEGSFGTGEGEYGWDEQGVPDASQITDYAMYEMKNGVITDITSDLVIGQGGPNMRIRQHDWSYQNMNGTADEYYVVVGYNTSGSSGRWMQENGKWWYWNADGSWPVSTWQQIDGDWYYFDGNGYAVCDGWTKDGRSWCWMDSSGVAVTSTWMEIGGDWYYFDGNGHAVCDGWAKDGRSWCWMDSSGVAVVKTWKQIDGDWYYFDAAGHAVCNGWVKDGAYWCWMDGNGIAVTNAYADTDEGRIWFDANGHAVT